MTENDNMSRGLKGSVPPQTKKLASITRKQYKKNLISGKSHEIANSNKNIADSQEALTISQAEHYLHISHHTMYKMLNEGVIRNYRIGRRRFITRKAIEDFINFRESEANYE